MNSDILQGQWKQIAGEARKHWAKLSGNKLDAVRGDRDKLIGLIQEEYGYTREKAELEVNQFLMKYRRNP